MANIFRRGQDQAAAAGKQEQPVQPEFDPNKHILTSDFSDEHGDKYWAKFSTEHFDSGVSRFAFKGTMRGSGPKKDKKCVVKVFKDEYAQNIDLWVPDLYTSIRAKELANEFTRDVLPKLKLDERVKNIDFVLPMLAKVNFMVVHFSRVM